jgi:hypothetical protein
LGIPEGDCGPYGFKKVRDLDGSEFSGSSDEKACGELG